MTSGRPATRVRLSGIRQEGCGRPAMAKIPGVEPVGSSVGATHRNDFAPSTVCTHIIDADPGDCMLIICPSCAAEYEVPVSRLRPGKMVRCVRCGGEWLPPLETEAEDPGASIADAAEPPHEHEDIAGGDEAAGHIAEPGSDVTAMDRLAASAHSRRRRPGLIGAWIATFVVLSGGVAASVMWRDAVIRVWPASGRILAGRQSTVALPPAASPPLAQTSDPAKATQATQPQKSGPSPSAGQPPQTAQTAGKKTD